MAAVFYFPLPGTPTADGNLLSFFQAGTSTPLDVWTDSDLSIPWNQPIVFNVAGNPDGPIYVSPSPSYKVVYTDSSGVAIPGYPVDFVSPSTIPGVMTTAIVTLTDAQIKALPTTPITLKAAPASGLRVRPLAVSLRINNTAGVYTNINTTYCALSVDWAGEWAAGPLINDSTTTPHLTQATVFFNTSHDYLVDLSVPYVQAMGAASGAQWVFSGDTNQPGQSTSTENAVALEVSVDNNGSGNFTGGNAANTLKVTVYYALESLS